MDREGPLTDDSSLERLRDEVLDRQDSTPDKDGDKRHEPDRETEAGVLAQLNAEDSAPGHPALD